jgi:phosphate-selective porin OprO/OprP
VRGSWWVQTEWIQSRVTASDLGDPVFGGAYVETGWFLTGETRFYRTEDGIFGRVRPKRLFRGGNPFTRKGDCGALEIVGRYSWIDLSDGTVSGGEMHNAGLGLNWYLTHASRFMVNYIHSVLRDGGNANLLLVRFQFNP